VFYVVGAGVAIALAAVVIGLVVRSASNGSGVRAGGPEPTTTAVATTQSTTSITQAQATKSPTTPASALTTQAPAATRTPTVTATATTTAPATSVQPTVRAAPTTPAPTQAAGATPPTLPDGSWPPIIAIFDTNKVTLLGYAPSEAAVKRLEALATANSKTHAPVDDHVKVDPRVPSSVGVRVIELTSSRFPSGSAGIFPAHAAELDRVVTIMKALPNITALVIGHADQIGTPSDNLILSQQRAQSVIDYLELKGIDPNRLSAKGVGASDPLRQDETVASLALNRRTEFVFYGLLAGA
jgi:outer membrane protein OmpA-like peptidoglycan-associated protein